MTKRITFFLITLLAVFSAYAQSEIKILDKTYKVDTLFHSTVGPGTTQTSLKLSGPGDLRVFYLTIDITNPLVKIRTVCAKDKVAGGETTSEMGKRKTAEGALYYAGVNGDFFATSGTASNGSSIIGTPTSACIVDGEIYKTSNGSKQFAMDINGLPFIGQANFLNGEIALGDKTEVFNGVNVNSGSNGVTIYTSRYYGSSNQPNKADACAEVSAKLVAGETFAAGRSCKMEITSTSTATGDLVIPDGGYVIHGRGTSINFVSGLKPGDIINVKSVVSIDNETIIPEQIISGNPRTVGNGETLDTEGERGDASAYHPRTGIGYGANKTKVIMMVIDGRSAISQGVRTSQFADVMRYAGATDAINLDGGGSSTLYTSALGVRNVTSDGKERADGNAIFAVCSAPTDTEIASIKFVDWAMKFPKQGVYTPKFFGYNKYGVLVDTDLKGVKLSCPKELGVIENDITFIGSGLGTYPLNAEYNGIKTSIPVTIVAPDKVSARLPKIIHDSYRKYAIEVMASMGETTMPIAASAFDWKSDDTNIVEINASGEITSKVDGETTVHGVLGENKVSTIVKVEKPTSYIMPMDPNMDISTWKIDQIGGKNIAATPLDNGLLITYDGYSGRAPNIRLSKPLTLWSLPDILRIRINPGEAPVKSITLSVSTLGGGTVNYAIPQTIEADKENILNVPVSELCDAKDIINYPLVVNSMTLYMGVSTTGKKYSISIPGMEEIFDALASVDDIVSSKANTVKIYPNPARVGENITLGSADDSEAKISIFSISGQLLSNVIKMPVDGKITLNTSSLTQGVYIIESIQNNIKNNATLIIR